MKKSIIIAVAMLCLCVAAGCGAQEPAAPEKESGNTEKMTQMSEQETVADNENMTQVSQNGSAIKETKDSVFFLGKRCIYIVDKASNQTQLLWKNDIFEPDYTVFDGCGVILGERLYFLEAVPYEEDGETVTVLSAINTDGSGYEQAVSKLDGMYSFNSIYYSDNILYAYHVNSMRCYKISEDGSLGEEVPRDETAFRYTENLSEDYSLLCREGEWSNFLSPVESIEKYGSLIMKKGTSYVKMDVESGSEEWINFGAPVCMDGGKAFYIGRESDVWQLESFDINTKETGTIGEIKGTGMLCTAYGNGTLYYMSNFINKKATVSYISVSDGTGGVLFELDDVSGYVNGFSPSYFGLMVSGDYLYYMDMRDYDAYLIRVRLDNPSQEEMLGAPVYSTHIKEVGKLVQENHEIYKETDPDVLLGTASLSWLAVDDSYEGANLINSYLYEKEVASAWAIFEDNVQTDEEFLDGSSIPYSYDTSVSRIRYFDGKYVSFIQEAYDYFGGAHGLPIWEGYAFDLETGERLLLLDIVSNTEEELKEIVTKYFGEKIDKNPENFWPDAKETVYDMISLEMTDFVLTDEGICFYIHPYSIAAYVEWFQDVTIPYSEFQLSLSLESEDYKK